MPNLYNKLMAKDMPRAAAAPTSRQMVQAPMGLRSAMKRYADGGELSSFSGEDGRSNQSLSFPQLSDPDEVRRYEIAKIMQEMDTRRTPEPSRYSTEAVRPPPEPVRYSPPPPEEPRYQPEKLQPERPPERPDVRPVMPEIYPQDYAGPRTTGSTQTQQVGPRTSYRQEADGTLTEIGYDGQPIAGYTPEQLAMHNATTGVTPSEFRYVWNGEGYDKLPNGPQIGYAPTRDIAEPIFPEKERPPEPRYEEPVAPYPEEPTPAPMPNYLTPAPMPNYPNYLTTAPTPNYPEELNFAPMPEEPQNNYDNQPMLNPQLELLRRALQGQGAGSKGNSQQLASLLQMLGYSK